MLASLLHLPPAAALRAPVAPPVPRPQAAGGRHLPLLLLASEEECRVLDEPAVAQPGLGSRFGKAWEGLGEDVDWVRVIGERLVDTIDDTFARRRSAGADAAHADPALPGAAGAATALADRPRPRVVVLGSGWGANALLSQLNGEQFDVTVVSPRSYFLFTPMLAGAALGTLEPRSIIEPIRTCLPRHSQYFEAQATAIDPEARVVSCQTVTPDADDCTRFDVQYDVCVVAVGAAPNTFGVPGVREHCIFLKQVADAMRFRERLSDALERASLPGLSDARLREILTFVVIGAGPTGVELCGELRDYVAQDVTRLYRRLLPYVRIVLLEASDKVLGAFDADMQQAALRRLRAGGAGVSVDVRTSAGVSEVRPKTIVLSDGEVLPYGVAVWAAGIGTLDFVRETAGAIPAQAEYAGRSRGRLAVDPWMRVIGAPGLLAFGDCAHVAAGDLPATAQVASQAGTFLGRLLTDGYLLDTDDAAPPLPDGAPGASTLRSVLRGSFKGVAPPFRFLNLGILAYVGGSEALVQVDVGGQGAKLKNAGRVGFALWRSVYLSKQYGVRNRMLVAVDWFKARLFGRDISRL